LPGISAAAQTTKGQTKMQTTISEHYKPPVRFGLGGVPLGNEFAVITEKDAYATLEAAWSAVIRYYDTSPWYGLGLYERRFGNFLHTKDRSEMHVCRCSMPNGPAAVGTPPNCGLRATPASRPFLPPPRGAIGTAPFQTRESPFPPTSARSTSHPANVTTQMVLILCSHGVE